jgi:hypothetical protein
MITRWGRHAVAREWFEHVVDEAVVCQVAPRHVDRDRGRREPTLGRPRGDLPRDRVDHPAVEIDDQRAPLREPDEAVRWHQSRLAGTSPAHERLERVQLLAAGVDDRLVVDDQLVLVDRLADRHRQIRGLGDLVAEVLVTDLDPAATDVLRPIHGEVGVAQQFVGRERGTVGHRDADARPDRHAGRARIDRLLERGPQPLRERHGLVHVRDRLGDHDELVATQAADVIAFADVVDEPLRHGGEHGVAGLVAVVVVDVLEPIEVDEQHGEVRAGSRGARERPGQLGHRGVAIGELG